MLGLGARRVGVAAALRLADTTHQRSACKALYADDGIISKKPVRSLKKLISFVNKEEVDHLGFLKRPVSKRLNRTWPRAIK